jgi:hypothetical protein
MKYAIAYSLYQKLKNDPKLAKRVAIIAAVGAGFAFIALIGVIWVGVVLLRPVATSVSQTLKQGNAQDYLAPLTNGVAGLESVKPLGCVAAFQSLAAAQPWLENSIETNLLTLRAGCLDGTGSGASSADASSSDSKEE